MNRDILKNISFATEREANEFIQIKKNSYAEQWLYISI